MTPALGFPPAVDVRATEVLGRGDVDAGCNCIRCQEARGPFLMMMPCCSRCGNKRCPKGTWHGNACTGSNDRGQPGSDYA